MINHRSPAIIILSRQANNNFGGKRFNRAMLDHRFGRMWPYAIESLQAADSLEVDTNRDSKLGTIKDCKL